MRYYLCRREKGANPHYGGEYFVYDTKEEMLEQVHMMITNLGWKLEDITVFDESKQICFKVNTNISIV